MKTLHLECPYCEESVVVSWDGTYKPRYWECDGCGRRFIYEPVADGVKCIKPEEAPCSSDPEFREIEMGAGMEE